MLGQLLFSSIPWPKTGYTIIYQATQYGVASCMIFVIEVFPDAINENLIEIAPYWS